MLWCEVLCGLGKKWFYSNVYYLILVETVELDRERAYKERRSKLNNDRAQKCKGNIINGGKNGSTSEANNGSSNNGPTSGADNAKGVFIYLLL